MLFYYLRNIFNSYMTVESALGVNYHNRTKCAKAETTCSDNLNLLFKPFFYYYITNFIFVYCTIFTKFYSQF